MKIIASIITLILLTLLITIILDWINNKDNSEQYRLATTALNLAIGFTTSLAVHLFIGFGTVGEKFLNILGLTI